MSRTSKRRAEEDLRATSDSIARASERIAGLEQEKRNLAPEDPRVEELSAEVVALTEGLRREGALEHELAKEIASEDPEPMH